MMEPMKKHRILTILSLLIFCALFFDAPQTVWAQAGTPAEVLGQINGLRAANGLAPLVENVYLSIAAQNHANWIAAGNPGGHTGAGGSSAQDRAIAVGYGDGAPVRVTENWARGPGLTAYAVVYEQWAPSGPHIGNMLTTWHDEFGAGVALDGSGMTVYVVKFGHTSGSAPPQPDPGPDEPVNTPGPIIQPITTAEPNPDGSVVHIVQYGQSLWAIVDAYEISMEDLLAQNGLTEDSAIFPDQELIIVPAPVEDEVEADVEETIQATATPEPTAQPTPTPTHTPTRFVERVEIVLPATPTAQPNLQANFLVNIFSSDSRNVGFGLIAVSVFGIALLFFTSARLR
jgi:uncharacterized protein YkwD/LysM repeat protein